MKSIRRLLQISVLVLFALNAILLLGGCAPKEKSIRIIGTSDLHGKFSSFDYALYEEDRSGSMLQLSSAVKEYRNDHTLLMDAGDMLQGNSAELFIQDEIHPVVQAINHMGYDICLTGNHEYDYDMDTMRRVLGKIKGHLLTGNVFLPDGKPLADGYIIIKKDGIRVAVIGMVTPNITRWSAKNLEGCTVTDPLEETRKIIDSIQGKYDVLVGVYHMGINNELDTPNSGVTDICNACPEFDLVISSHEHKLIESMDINGVLVVQNSNRAKTMSVIDLDLEKTGGSWKVTQKNAKAVKTADYADDPELAELLAPYDERARENALTVIGRIEGVEENQPAVLFADTPAGDLIHEVQLYYSGAAVSVVQTSNPNLRLQNGDLRKCDVSQIYKYANTLYKMHMNGRQLKMLMEWGCRYYNTVGENEPVSFNDTYPDYLNCQFEGVDYEVNLTKEEGERIENLRWPDGTPVREDEEFDVAMSNYIAGSVLLNPGTVYEENDLPVLVEQDVHGEIGGVRELLGDYIVNVNGGVIRPVANNNWKITGAKVD